MHLYGENIEKSFPENLLKTNGWILQGMIKLLNFFLVTVQILSIGGSSALAPGLYTC